MAPLSLLCAGLALTCAQSPDEPEPTPPPYAQVAVAEQMAAAAALPHDPADGAGRASIVEGGDVVCATRGRWQIEFEAGPLGVVEGGSVFLQVSPFWGWSTPQVLEPRREGFTRVSTAVAGLELEARTIDQQLLAVTLRGRGLAAGERLLFDYGCGPAQARADSYAEACSRFWIAVDGNGDGVRRVIADSPCVAVLPGPAARLVVHAPGVVRPGEELRVRVAVLDGTANAVREVSGALSLSLDDDPQPALEGQLALEQGGAGEYVLALPGEGIHRVRARLEIAGALLEAESNPFDVTSRAPRILWADLHGHSADSDGTGTPADYFRYAREVAGLDVAALTDHDHWGMLFLDEAPALWEANVAAARQATRPGRFLGLPGYEWTSWLWGHRNVVFFGASTPLLSSIDARHDLPSELAAGLAGLDAVALPHHPAGGPIAVDWSLACRDELECAVEVASAHGMCEAPDVPHPIYSAVPGTWVREAMGLGITPGWVASGDGHDGHPGLSHLGPQYPSGGAAAILSETREPSAVLAALRARRSYATSGPRMILRFALGGARMGEELRAADVAGENNLYVAFAGTAAVRSVTVVRSGVEQAVLDGDGSRDVRLTGSLSDLQPGEWVYVRVIQEDGHAAWSSPIWLR